jgi:hypothetical protein
MVWLFLTLVLLALVRAARPVESYSESLLAKRLDETSVGFRFEFVSRKLTSTQTQTQQFETFPKLVDHVFTVNATELRLVLTRGTWRWGSETMFPSVRHLCFDVSGDSSR